MAYKSGYEPQTLLFGDLGRAYDSAPSVLKDSSKSDSFPTLPSPDKLRADRKTCVLVHRPYWNRYLGNRPDDMEFVPGSSRLFTDANLGALDLFRYKWFVEGRPDLSLVGTDSRLSAPPVEALQANRDRIFEEVNALGFAFAYSGTRIRRDGSTFRIHGAAIWKVMDEHGRHVGEAAAFRRPR